MAELKLEERPATSGGLCLVPSVKQKVVFESLPSCKCAAANVQLQCLLYGSDTASHDVNLLSSFEACVAAEWKCFLLLATNQHHVFPRLNYHIPRKKTTDH